MKKNIRTIWILLAYVIVISLVIGVIVYSLSLKLSPVEIKINEILIGGRGGHCKGFFIYDDSGIGHNVFFDIISYTGPGPLYYVQPDLVNAKEIFSGCYEFPETISPSLVTSGIPYYPLDIEIKLSSGDEINSNESALLDVSVNFSDEYSENSYAIPFSQKDSHEVVFELQTTNFDYAPKNEEVKPSPITLSLPIIHRWVISPKDKTMGEQYLMVAVYIDNHQVPFEISLDVRSLIGTNPIVLAIGAAIGSGIIGMLTITKTILEIREKVSNLRKKKRTRYSKSRKRK
ncbi:MAG: hypothetical protein KJ638_08915 [Chloroflexi bacterium]|nr:hypothetical protein [Chloroflexota bacterium]